MLVRPFDTVVRQATALALLFVGACTGAIGRDGAGGADGFVGGSGSVGAGGGAGIANPASCSAGPPGPPALRRLTRLEYVNAAAELVGRTLPSALTLPADEALAVFRTNAGEVPSEAAVLQYADAAETVAASAADRLWAESGCKATDLVCAGDLIGKMGRRAFRRPLVADELAAFKEAFEEARMERPAEQAFRLVLQAILQSPFFLYHVEEHGGVDTATGVARLSASSLAARLSFALGGAPPDPELARAAADGELDTRDGVTKHARRLIDSARAKIILNDFVAQWLSIDELKTTAFDPKEYPEYTPSLRRAMEQETEARVARMLDEQGGNLLSLFRGAETVWNGGLSDIYGRTGAEGAIVKLDPNERAGILTSPAWLAATHGPVLRGKIILRDLLCEDLPPPPPGTDIRLPPLAAGQTPRARLEGHAKAPQCRGCHERMDAVGFAFEGYDELGRARNSYPSGAAVDASGRLELAGKTIEFHAAPGLIQELANAPALFGCASQQLFRYLTARNPNEGDVCAIAKAAQAAAAKSHDVRELALELVASEAFTHVTPAKE